MLAEGDPLATALLAQYQGIPMPNLRLTDVDAEKLLGYIDEESRRVERLRTAEAARAGDRHAHHGGHDGHAGHAGRHPAPGAGAGGR